MSERPILVVWPEYPPSIGGMQVHGVEFARFLDRQGVPFLLVTNEPESVEHAADCREHDQSLGIWPLRILKRRDFRQSRSVLRTLTAALRPRAVFSSQVAFAGEFQDVPRVVCRSAGNDVLRPWIGPYEISFKKLRKLSFEEQRRRLEVNRQWALESADRCTEIVCNSQWTADQLAALGLHRLSVVAGGVDIDHFRPMDRQAARDQLGLAGEGVAAIIVARHVLKKGIDVAIEALTLPECPPMRLWVVGDGPETDHLRSLAHDLGVAPRVDFLGALPHYILPQYLAAADLLLQPSRSVYDPRRFAVDHETMGRALCEAGACGIPVVASKTGGIPSVVRDGETGLLVRPNDPAELALAVRRLVETPDEARRLGAAARQWVVSQLSFHRVHNTVLQKLEGRAHEEPTRV
jgi:glycosyltransferase involved in cell wall biosynthesis